MVCESCRCDLHLSFAQIEEDDDDFLAAPIEFGDGTQYKVQPGQATPKKDAARARPETDSLPVSKEERFVEDFDRSWPKSRGSTSTASTPLTHPASLPSTGHDLTHRVPSVDNRALFNERSNRLEPPKTTRPDPHVEKPQPGPPPTSVWTRRKLSAASDIGKAHTPSLPPPNGALPNRDPPPHTNVQLLQKPIPSSVRPSTNGFPAPPAPRRGSTNFGDRDNIRWDSALLSPASSTGFLPSADRSVVI